jgi:hypothetical protein
MRDGVGRRHRLSNSTAIDNGWPPPALMRDFVHHLREESEVSADLQLPSCTLV